MKSAISIGSLATLLAVVPAFANSFQDIIRDAARRNGFVSAAATHIPANPDLAAPGGGLFESKALSLNGNISCQTCHLDEFGSTDGIPNAVAVGGKGKGRARVMGGGGYITAQHVALLGARREGLHSVLLGRQG